MKKQYIVYRLDFPNGMSYIGQRSAGPLDGYWSSSKVVKAYIDEHGTDGIVKSIICYCNDKEHLNLTEGLIQEFYDVVKSKEFYNRHIQGGKFDSTDPETRANISKAKKGQRTRLGAKQSKKTKNKISRAKKGNQYRLGGFKVYEIIYDDGSQEIYDKGRKALEKEWGVPTSTLSYWLMTNRPKKEGVVSIRATGWTK